MRGGRLMKGSIEIIRLLDHCTFFFRFVLNADLSGLSDASGFLPVIDTSIEMTTG